MPNEQKFLLCLMILFHTIYLFCHSIQYDFIFVSHYQIDINNCSLDDLSAVPGIGKKRAGKIYLYRTKRGQINSLDDILMIKGIGKKFIIQIKPYIYIQK